MQNTAGHSEDIEQFIFAIATVGNPKSGQSSTRMTLTVLYSAQHHRQHRTLRAFEQYGTLWKHNLDDKNPTRSRFEPRPWR